MESFAKFVWINSENERERDIYVKGDDLKVRAGAELKKFKLYGACKILIVSFARRKTRISLPKKKKSFSFL